MGKVVALIDKDPKLKEICSRIHGRKEQLRQKIKFLQKQAEDAVEEMKQSDQPDWDLLIEHLKTTGAIDGYDKNKQNLSFAMEDNSIELNNADDEQEHPLAAILGKLMR